MNEAAVMKQFVSKLKRVKKPILDKYGSGTGKIISQLTDARKRGYLTRAELFEIRKEKSSRKAGAVNNNSEDEVKEITRLAFNVTNEEIRISLLSSLYGVAVPTASAMLSWTFPERWAVIDKRAWATLYRGNIVQSKPEGTGLGRSDWSRYVKVINHLSGELQITPQQVDRLLYGLDKECDKEAK